VHGEHERAGGVPRQGGKGCWGLSPQVAGSLALSLLRGGAPVAGRCPPRRWPAAGRRAPRRNAPWVMRSASWPGWSSRARYADRRVKITTPGQNAAHCPGWPLQRQGHPRSFLTASQKRSLDPPLSTGASTSPAGLTAGARPEARAANLTSLKTSSLDHHQLVAPSVRSHRNKHLVSWMLRPGQRSSARCSSDHLARDQDFPT
jgi:hypothetical protein